MTVLSVLPVQSLYCCGFMFFLACPLPVLACPLPVLFFRNVTLLFTVGYILRGQTDRQDRQKRYII